MSINHLSISEFLLHSGQNRHHVGRLATCHPVSDKFLLRISQRTYDRYLRDTLQRQDGIVILQKHHGLLRHFLSMRYSLRLQINLLRRTHVNIRPLEKPEPELQTKHTPDALIHRLHADQAVVNEPRKILPIKIIHHIHVNAGVYGQCCRFVSVLGRSLIRQLDYRIPVGNDHSVPVPFLLEDIRHGIFVGRSRYAADIVEGAHHRGST